MQRCWYRLKNRQMYRKTNIHTYCTYIQYCTLDRHADRQTDRQDRQKKIAYRPTNLQTDNI